METATFVTPNDIEAYRQRVDDLDRALQSALDSGDAANASRIAGQAAEARNELRQLQSQFEVERAMFEQEQIWINQQNAKVHEIQRSIAEQREMLDDTQQKLHQYLNDMNFVQTIIRVRHSIRVYQANLEQQNLQVDSIDMTSHPSAANAQQAAVIAANPSVPLLSIRAVRRAMVERIQRELAHADQLEHHVGEFEKLISLIQQPVC